MSLWQRQAYLWHRQSRERGQIVIPKEAREIFDIKPGDTLLVLATNPGNRHCQERDLSQFALDGPQRSGKNQEPE
jgi:AbrB family looped-hinge helix DNA binding protein